MATKRIYLVRDKTTATARLVKTTHPDIALRHVAQSVFEARVATQEDCLAQAAAGVKVEEVGAEPAATADA